MLLSVSQNFIVQVLPMSFLGLDLQASLDSEIQSRPEWSENEAPRFAAEDGQQNNAEVLEGELDHVTRQVTTESLLVIATLNRSRLTLSHVHVKTRRKLRCFLMTLIPIVFSRSLLFLLACAIVLAEKHTVSC